MIRLRNLFTAHISSNFVLLYAIIPFLASCKKEQQTQLINENSDLAVQIEELKKENLMLENQIAAAMGLSEDQRKKAVGSDSYHNFEFKWKKRANETIERLKQELKQVNEEIKPLESEREVLQGKFDELVKAFDDYQSKYPIK